MRSRTLGLLTVALFAAIDGLGLHAQSASAHDRAEVAIAYDYTHSNTPAGGCGCFRLNGGSASVAVPLHHAGLSVVGDIAAAHAGAISSSGQDLTLSTFTGGLRYSLPGIHARLRPFAQILVGVAHASGSLVDGPGSSSDNSGAAFASVTGGGVDLRATHHLSLRLIEADYLLTTFNNGSNDHQNNLRIGTGLVFRF